MNIHSGKKIVFWAWKNRPSLKMRGFQVAQALLKIERDVEVRTGPSWCVLKDLHDTTIICVKSFPRWTKSLQKRGNRLVYDAIDLSSHLRIPKNAKVVVAGTQDMKRRLQAAYSNGVKVHTIYHHADPGLQRHLAGEKSLRLVYIGEPESSRFLNGEIPELSLVSFKRNAAWREEIRQFNAHFSARMDPNKSVVKLANVAQLGAVFLTGREPGCEELLGEDYPFYLENPYDIAAVRKDVLRLKESIGTDIWKLARERIEEVRSRLTLESTGKAYHDLVKAL